MVAKFNFKAFRNPKQELFVASPPEKDAITFTLSPVNTDVSFLANRLNKSIGHIEAEELQFQLGYQRVIGWEGIVDENDTPIEFSNKNFGMFLSMPESIDYMMLIGKHTFETVFPDVKGTVEGNVIPAPLETST